MRFSQSMMFADARQWVELARHAEGVGFHQVALSDHVFYPDKLTSSYPYTPDGRPLFRPDTAWPDVWVMVGAMASVTERIEFTTNVYVLPARNPFVVAKAVGTAAFLTGDRVSLGVGAGWMREEFEALGFGHTFDPRGKATDEAIHLFRSAWTTDGPIEAHGEVYDVNPVLMWPKPARQGKLPIWIGGHGRRSIRRAAELGDGWQPLRIPVEELTGYIGYLREQLARYDRRPEDVTISLGVSALPPGSGSGASAQEWELAGDPDASAEKLKRYAAAGVEHFLVNCPRGASLQTMLESYEYVAREVRPRVAAS